MGTGSNPPALPLAVEWLRRGSLGGGAVTGEHLLVLYPEYEWPSSPPDSAP